MKVLLIILLLNSVICSAEVECKRFGLREFKELREGLVMEGKGEIEMNSIINARINICIDKCIFNGEGLCLADVKEKKK